MEYLTTYYRRQGEGSGCSLLLQHYLCGQTPVCLACICTVEGEKDGGVCRSVTGRLLDWCRTVCWHKAAKKPDIWLERLEAELLPMLEEAGAEYQGGRLTLLLGVGGEILTLGGGHNLYLLSSLWGKGKTVRLPGQFRGRLEPGAGMLLATDSFLHHMEEKRLGEALHLQEIRTEDQAARRLKELAAAGDRTGCGITGEPAGAILVIGKGGELPVTLSMGKDYRVMKLLGSGAFAQVYLVKDREGKNYACKVSKRGGLLAREAEFQRAALHSLFPVYIDFWQERGIGFLLMEYVPGESLDVILRRKGAFSDRQAAGIGCRLAEGLSYLHEGKLPLVFRDVKPSNVMLTPEGGVRLLDFGCVCPAGRNADRAGTPEFGAPEQFVQGGRQTAAADIYGLGSTLQALTGGKPGGLLKRITDRCTRQDPRERLSNMQELAKLLKLCAEGGGGRMSGRQKAALKGEIWVLQDIHVW